MVAVEFLGIMSRDDRYLVPVQPHDLAQPGLVAEPQFPVHLRPQLDEVQQRVGAGMIGIYLAVVEVGVAGVQQPALPGVHCDRAVAFAVAAERDEQDVSGQPVKSSYGIEAEPLIAFVAGIGGPAGAMRKLRGAVAVGGPGNRRLVLSPEHVDRGLRKIGKPAGVVPIEMRQHDVPHVVRCVTDVAKLVQGSLSQVEGRFGEGHPLLAEGVGWVQDVVGAQARLDQDQPVRIGLGQQAMADGTGGAQRAVRAVGRVDLPHGATIEVINAHGHGLSARIDWLICPASRRATESRTLASRRTLARRIAPWRAQMANSATGRQSCGATPQRSSATDRPSAHAPSTLSQRDRIASLSAAASSATVATGPALWDPDPPSLAAKRLASPEIAPAGSSAADTMAAICSPTRVPEMVIDSAASCSLPPGKWK